MKFTFIDFGDNNNRLKIFFISVLCDYFAFAAKIFLFILKLLFFITYPHITNPYITKTPVQRTIFFGPLIGLRIQWADTMSPRYNEYILPVPCLYLRYIVVPPYYVWIWMYKFTLDNLSRKDPYREQCRCKFRFAANYCSIKMKEWQIKIGEERW